MPMHLAQTIYVAQITVAILFVVAGIMQLVRRLGRSFMILSRVLFVLLFAILAFGKFYATRITVRLAQREQVDSASALSDSTYTYALKLNPENSTLYFWRGRASFKAQRYNDAVSDFSKALEFSPNQPTYLEHRAFARLFVHDLAGAESDVKRSIALGDRDADARMVEGLIAAMKGQYANAIAYYSQALSAGLNRANVCYVLTDRAFAYKSIKRYDEALRDLSKAYDDCPDLKEDILVDRGSIHSLLLQDTAALKDWDEALSIDPTDPVVFRNRGLLYSSDGDTQAALSDFTRYITLRPNDPIGYTLRADLYLQLGQIDKSEADLLLARNLAAANRGGSNLAVHQTKTAYGDLPT